MNYQSEKTDLVLQAIEDARQEFSPLEKSGVNAFFKNKKGEPHYYSTLDNIFDACMPALHAHKLSLMYQVRLMEVGDALENVLTTTITHLPSNQYVSSCSTLGSHLSKSQDIGSAITYFRRYQIQAMLNLEADFEDDGNLASGNKGGESNIIETQENNTMPKRKYVIFDKDGKISHECTSFGTYLGDLKKNMTMIKQNHNCCSATIIQLQDIDLWSDGLDKKHAKNVAKIKDNCAKYIKLFKGE
jgi:hypothetical protein